SSGPWPSTCYGARWSRPRRAPARLAGWAKEGELSVVFFEPCREHRRLDGECNARAVESTPAVEKRRNVARVLRTYPRFRHRRFRIHPLRMLKSQGEVVGGVRQHPGDVDPLPQIVKFRADLAARQPHSRDVVAADATIGEQGRLAARDISARDCFGRLDRPTTVDRPDETARNQSKPDHQQKDEGNRTAHARTLTVVDRAGRASMR